MGDNRLNFNRPLLSVRRSSSTAASQKDSRMKTGSSRPAISPSSSFKSELQSGPLRKPGSVPFVWEQSPGRPKDDTKPQKLTKVLVPNLPPGRILKLRSSKETKKDISHSMKNDDGGNDDMYMDALDTPSKHEPESEKPREVKKVVNRDNGKPKLTYGPNFLQFIGDDSEENSDFDYDEHETTSFKFCGLLPHFCLKGSIGVLNPVPGLSMRTRSPISSANGTRVGSASSNSQPSRVAVYEHRSLSTQQKDEIIFKKNSQKLEGSGLYDRLQAPGIPNKFSESSPPFDFERKEVNLQTNGLISFKELLAVEDEKEARTQNPTVEKTVYIDTIHKVDSGTNGRSDCKENDLGIFVISHIPTDSSELDLLDDKSKQDKDTKTQTSFRKDQKISRLSELELPAPPPLPKSPSDSWLWRTLPSVTSKTASLRSNVKNPAKMDKNVQLQNPKGLLLPIPEA